MRALKSLGILCRAICAHVLCSVGKTTLKIFLAKFVDDMPYLSITHHLQIIEEAQFRKTKKKKKQKQKGSVHNHISEQVKNFLNLS